LKRQATIACLFILCKNKKSIYGNLQKFYSIKYKGDIPLKMWLSPLISPPLCFADEIISSFIIALRGGVIYQLCESVVKGVIIRFAS
jgi:hypothetical protein